jgi:cellulose synthase/poly-beta-1,6-N-acetylglucosamine synthase-like glycosyltransferase
VNLPYEQIVIFCFNNSPYFIIFSILLVFAEMYTILHFLNALYAFWPHKYKTYTKTNYNKDLTINLLICVCGEPTELVRQTIIAAKRTAEVYTQKIHPLTTPRVVVMNDGYIAKKDNWEEIEKLCKELKVIHIMRKIPGGYKAGNINNALEKLPANNPHNTIDIVFDADFAALPHLLNEITKPFMDDSVDFVQTPQRYRNEKTWIAKAAGSHQINFFEYYCAAKAHDNALFLCGTNFAIRRSALDAVNRMDTRFINEDYSTSLNLHLVGKKGIFIKEPLAVGAAPSTLKAYFTQQQRWAKGTFDTSFAYMPKILFGSLTFKQKLHYFIASTYYLIGIRDFIIVLGPLPYLWFNVPLVQANPHNIVLYFYLPLILFNITTSLLLVRHPIRSLVLNLITFPIFFKALLSSIFKKKLGFVVTIKKYEQENVFVMYKTQLTICVLLIAGLSFNIFFYKPQGTTALLNYFWTCYDILCLSIGFVLMVKENYISKLDEFAYSKLQNKKLQSYKTQLNSFLNPINDTYSKRFKLMTLLRRSN